MHCSSACIRALRDKCPAGVALHTNAVAWQSDARWRSLWEHAHASAVQRTSHEGNATATGLSLSLCVCVSLCTNDRKQSAHTPITDGLSALFTYHVKDAREQQPWKRFRTGAGILGARAVAPSWVTRRGPRLLRLQLLWLKAQRAWHSRSMSRKIQIDSLMSIL
jgi:hypothetical protein